MTDESTNAEGAETFVGACSECGKKLRMPENLRGEAVLCRSCREESASEPSSTPVDKPSLPRPGLPPVKSRVSPDSLMGDFQGGTILNIAIFALVLHVVIVVGTSPRYIYDCLFGPATSEMSKEKKVQQALAEATSALSDIAEDYEIQVDDITERFTATGSRASRIADEPGDDDPATDPDETAPTSPEPATDTPAGEGDGGMSSFEKNMTKPVPGPDDPATDPDDDMTGL